MRAISVTMQQSRHDAPTSKRASGGGKGVQGVEAVTVCRVWRQSRCQDSATRGCLRECVRECVRGRVLTSETVTQTAASAAASAAAAAARSCRNHESSLMSFMQIRSPASLASRRLRREMTCCGSLASYVTDCLHEIHVMDSCVSSTCHTLLCLIHMSHTLVSHPHVTDSCMSRTCEVFACRSM